LALKRVFQHFSIATHDEQDIDMQCSKEEQHSYKFSIFRGILP
jgi:hypothetical protein